MLCKLISQCLTLYFNEKKEENPTEDLLSSKRKASQRPKAREPEIWIFWQTNTGTLFCNFLFPTY